MKKSACGWWPGLAGVHLQQGRCGEAIATARVVNIPAARGISAWPAAVGAELSRKTGCPVDEGIVDDSDRREGVDGEARNRWMAYRTSAPVSDQANVVSCAPKEIQAFAIHHSKFDAAASDRRREYSRAILSTPAIPVRRRMSDQDDSQIFCANNREPPPAVKHPAGLAGYGERVVT